MKKIISIAFLAAVLFTSCDSDNLTFEGTAVGLNQTFASVSVPSSGATETYPVQITSTSSEERTFGLEFVGDAPAAGGVSLGSITVPANSYEGTATVNFDFNSINLADGTTETFFIRATSTSTDIIVTELEIEYFKAIVCNDATLTINTDSFASETGFQIIDDAGVIVYELATGSLANGVQTFTADIFLADGCYTAVITDSYADGQVDSTTVGDYSITCSILTFASGGGSFGASQSVPFCVNQ
ncbi:hypothetical protein [Nonlabens sp. Asnod3-A02]|uniref:hypothetical protein n=1 Tax=Nonlabens sp. Asnod3-A02 TaxID=3160579 RepID=UPI0038631AA8